MVCPVPHEDITHVPDRALRARVVLSYTTQNLTREHLPSSNKTEDPRPTRTREPRPRLVDVHLPRRVVEPQEAAREDRHVVLLVVDVRHGERAALRVDVVREVLVAHARETVAHETRRDVRDVQWEVNGVEQTDRGACRSECGMNKNKYVSVWRRSSLIATRTHRANVRQWSPSSPCAWRSLFVLRQGLPEPI